MLKDKFLDFRETLSSLFLFILGKQIALLRCRFVKTRSIPLRFLDFWNMLFHLQESLYHTLYEHFSWENLQCLN